jgi:hypothetical protein
MGSERFGYAWLSFAIALAVHVTDEATHNFLSVYNPTVLAIRARLPFLPLPTFTFEVWLTGLVAGIALLLALSPLAFRGNRVLRILAIPLAVIAGLFNAAQHILGSLFYFHDWMPGVYSAPLLLVAATWLLMTAQPRRPMERARA